MKKLLCIFLVLIFLTSCTAVEEQSNKTEEKKISAVWIFFDELSMKKQHGGTENEYRGKIEKMFSDCKSVGINTVFFHVRPYSDAFYPSEIFPWSAYLTGTQGKEVEYDPLRIAVETAHSNGISLHAWMNPFRIAVSEDISLLSEDNPSLKWIKEKSPNVVNVNGGYYYSPASPGAQRLIIDGVREIVGNYEVDGIHIDDYFYPSTEKFVDSYFYEKYKSDGGELKLSEWRLNTVSAFVSELYRATKSVNSDCIFSISPAGNIKNNYNQQFADVRLWMSSDGYADWMIPQLYYGFENEILPFDNACDAWCSMKKSENVKLIIGIGAYKVNESDDEWTAGNGIINKQLDYLKTKENCIGAAFFSYSSIFKDNNISEFSDIGTKLIS